MGYMIQTGSDIADASKITVSAWFRTPAADMSYFNLISIADTSSPSLAVCGVVGNFYNGALLELHSGLSVILSRGGSYIWSTTNASDTNTYGWIIDPVYLDFLSYCNNNGAPVNDPDWWLVPQSNPPLNEFLGPSGSGAPTGGYQYPGAYVDMTPPATGYIWGITGSGATGTEHISVTSNAWHHLFFSADISGTDKLGWIVFDGTLVGAAGRQGAAIDLTPGAPINGTAAGFTSFPILGKAIGIPDLDDNIYSLHGGLSLDPTLEMADFQAWFGTYIPPSADNFAKFVSVSGSVGRPASPAVAASAFGTQDLLFTGKASTGAFFINQGTGGTFTKFGSAADFLPSPTY